jgi:ankyrin repeat protein
VEGADEIVVVRSSARIVYISSNDWLFNPPAGGSFTDDDDKPLVIETLKMALTAKIADVAKRGSKCEFRMFAAMHRVLSIAEDVNGQSIEKNSFAISGSYSGGSDDETSSFLDRYGFSSTRDVGDAGFGPLHCAAVEDNATAISTVLKDMVYVDSRVHAGLPRFTISKGDTPLMWAVSFGSFAAVRALLDARADINARNENMWTPLLMACRACPLPRRPAMIEHLLRHSADPATRDIHGATPVFALSVSITSGPALVEAAKVLLDNGGTATCSNGLLTPLHSLPLSTGYAPLAQLLIDYRADVNYRSHAKTIVASIVSNTALVRAWVGYRSSYDDVVSQLRGATCLHVAALMDQVDTCRVFLEARVDPGRRNFRGNTALDIACESKSYGAEALLREHMNMTATIV